MLACLRNHKIEAWLTGLKISNVNDDALEIVRATSCQLEVLLLILASSTICVGKHLELERERDFGVNLRRRTIELLEAL